jgi:hypothetical protein
VKRDDETPVVGDLWQLFDPGTNGRSSVFWEGYVVTGSHERADDGHHPFLVVHVHCLTDESGGTDVYSPISPTNAFVFSQLADMDWDEAWRPE